MKEVELKLDCAPADRQSVEAVLDRLGERRGTRDLLSTYYDTPDLALRGCGLSLRVRRSAVGFVQTVKSVEDRQGGMFEREEWETDVSGPSPDAEALAETPVPGLVDVRALAPAFTVSVRRTLWRIRSSESEIEVALDEGVASAGARSESFVELEFELNSGEALALFDLVPHLSHIESLRLGIRSKSDRGYLLLPQFTGQPAAAEPASSNGLSAALVQFRQAELEKGPSARLSASARDLAVALGSLRDSVPRPELLRLERETAWLAGRLAAGSAASVLGELRCRQLVFDLAKAAQTARTGEPA